jgi:hypothetical protein
LGKDAPSGLGELIRSLERAFEGLDNAGERIITAADLIPYEQVDDDTAWLKDCARIELQSFGTFQDPETVYVASLCFISSACGDVLDVDIRGTDRSVFASLGCVWAKAADLDNHLDPAVVARFAAVAVKPCSWPRGFTGPWGPINNRVMEFDTWVYYIIQQRIGRLKQRFKAFILFEELHFPQLSILASEANPNEDLWSSVMRLLNSFFARDKMTVDS